jgi:tetratricopeptide (TPR) repeat protein
LFKNGAYEVAIQAFDKAIEINPQYAAGWRNKAIALGYPGKYNETIQASDKAILR